jgi:hypothetical protein
MRGDHPRARNFDESISLRGVPFTIESSYSALQSLIK